MCAHLIGALLIVCAIAAHAGDDRDAFNGSPRYQHALKVFDAQGRVIGRLAHLGGQEGVYLNVNQATIFALIEHKPASADTYYVSQFEWAGSVYVPYTSPDCSGAPLVPESTTCARNDCLSSPRPVLLVRTGTDVTAYIAPDTYAGAPHVNSTRRAFIPGCNSESTDGSTFWPSGSTYSLTEHYPEPLSIRF